MRRSASQTIRNLEMRIARLETRNASSVSDIEKQIEQVESLAVAGIIPKRQAVEITTELRTKLDQLKNKKSSTRNASDFDPRKAVVYFDLTLDEDSALEAGVDESSILDMEMQAVKNIERFLKVRVGNEGHDRFGNLICKFSLNSLEHAEKLMETISRNAERGHDTLDTDVEYLYAENFMFYPQGLRGNSYSIDGEGDADGDLFAYLEYQGVI